jgi:hypothetical protein
MATETALHVNSWVETSEKDPSPDQNHGSKQWSG